MAQVGVPDLALHVVVEAPPPSPVLQHQLRVSLAVHEERRSFHLSQAVRICQQ